MSDNFPEELERAYARIEELEHEAKEMVRNLRNYAHIAWWRTYNAALTGLYANRDYKELNPGSVEIDSHACNAANLAHGKLVQP